MNPKINNIHSLISAYIEGQYDSHTRQEFQKIREKDVVLARLLVIIDTIKETDQPAKTTSLRIIPINEIDDILIHILANDISGINTRDLLHSLKTSPVFYRHFNILVLP